MNYTKVGIAACASSLLSLGGCGILDTVDLPSIRFDSNTYIVQPGDTLESVADRYDVDPNALVSVNALQVARLVPGQRLLLVRDGDAATGAITSQSLADGERVVLVPAASQRPSKQVLETQPLATTNGVTVEATTPTERVIGVRDSSADDELLGTGEPVFVADLPTLPVQSPQAELPTLADAPVIEDVRVDQTVAMVDRPEGAETIIGQGGVDMPITQIPMAASEKVPAQSETVDVVKRVTVNTREDGWNWPALGEITREFDLQEINRQGLDIKAAPGAGVQAAADGEVVYSGRDLASYGNLVILRHEDNFLTAYSKVSDIFVKENQKVKAGDLIAVVSEDAGANTELHFEIRRNGEPVNPIDYLPAL